MKTASTLLLSIAYLLVAALADAAEPITIGGLTFKPTSDWTSKEPSSAMREAEFEITPEGASEPLTAVFFVFGGGVEANISRWLTQFEGTPVSERKDHKFDGDKVVTIVSAKGTYLDGPPMSSNKTPRPGYQLLGAIAPADDGRDIFIKLTGPEKDVAAIAEKFTAFATSPFAK